MHRPTHFQLEGDKLSTVLLRALGGERCALGTENPAGITEGHACVQGGGELVAQGGLATVLTGQRRRALAGK